MPLQHMIRASVHRGDSHFVAECWELAVITQGKTLEETFANLQEAVVLHLENEDLEEMGLVPNPAILVTMELELVHA